MTLEPTLSYVRERNLTMEKRLYFNLHENMSSIKTEPLKETFYLAHSRTTTESQEPLCLCQDH